MAAKPVATKKKTSKSIKSETERVPKGTLFFFRLDFPPVPAARPRVARWGTYYPKTYKVWMEDAFKALIKFERPVRISNPVNVSIIVRVPRPKTTERAWPRGDVDNYAKAALDAVTKAGCCWEDDDQVVNLSVIKQYSTLNDCGIHIAVDTQ